MAGSRVCNIKLFVEKCKYVFGYVQTLSGRVGRRKARLGASGEEGCKAERQDGGRGKENCHGESFAPGRILNCTNIGSIKNR